MLTDYVTHWPSPAKLNLFLHILGQRADGYHQLQTIFQLLDWGDTISIRVRDDAVIMRTSALCSISEDHDLTLRAAKILQKNTGSPYGAEITVEKHIPMGGGLGGGSSNAATVLVALNNLWQCQLSNYELMQLAVQLGADVPVFVNGYTAWADGIGELLTPIHLQEQYYVIVNPNIFISTAQIFSSPELPRNTSALTVSNFQNGCQTRNDLEAVALKLFPDLLLVKKWIEQYTEARMTGSGGCWFGIFNSREMAQDIAAHCPSAWGAWAVKGISCSPLLTSWQT